MTFPVAPPAGRQCYAVFQVSNRQIPHKRSIKKNKAGVILYFLLLKTKSTMLLLILSKINFLKKVKYFFWDYFQRWIKYAFSALVSIYSRPVYERTQCNNHPFLIENFNVNILFQKLFQPIGKKDSAHRCKMSGISSQTKHLV